MLVYIPYLVPDLSLEVKGFLAGLDSWYSFPNYIEGIKTD